MGNDPGKELEVVPADRTVPARRGSFLAHGRGLALGLPDEALDGVARVLNWAEADSRWALLDLVVEWRARGWGWDSIHARLPGVELKTLKNQVRIVKKHPRDAVPDRRRWNVNFSIYLALRAVPEPDDEYYLNLAVELSPNVSEEDVRGWVRPHKKPVPRHVCPTCKQPVDRPAPDQRTTHLPEGLRAAVAGISTYLDYLASTAVDAPTLDFVAGTRAALGRLEPTGRIVGIDPSGKATIVGAEGERQTGDLVADEEGAVSFDADQQSFPGTGT